jgi:hypothetical protein
LETDKLPTYLFKNKETNEEFEVFMAIKELDEYKEKNPHLEQLVNGAPMIGDPFRLGRKKPKDNFRERLRQIKKDHPGNNIEVW